jgi:hypothetical protein|tara:strand:+ start:316 stop:516 length:201 start_codon:yes stop_codon:yes gene_type:complete
MKAGDLVELSAMGTRLDYLDNYQGMVGLVLKKKTSFHWSPWLILWSGRKTAVALDRPTLKIVKNRS